MDQHDTSDPESRQHASCPPSRWSDAELHARLQAGEAAAIAELYVRFTLLLRREACDRGVGADDIASLVHDTITAAAFVLMRPQPRASMALGGYLVTALRRHAANHLRDQRYADARTMSLEDAEATGHLRTSESDAADEPTVVRDDMRTLLMTALRPYLRPGDEQLLLWLADHVAQREIAEWLGVGHAAVRARVSRLRERMHEVARRHAATLPDDERAELERFLGRVNGARRPVPSTPAPSAARAGRGRPHGSSTEA